MPGTTVEVTMHDGSRLRLRKLEEDYDPTHRIDAIHRLLEAHEKQEVLTGVFYVNPEAPSFLDLLNMTDAAVGDAAGVGDSPEPGSARTVHGRVALASA